MKFVFAAILVAAAVATADIQRYNNYSVYRLKPNNVLQLSYLQSLQEEGVDFWREADQVNRIADIMLAPEQKSAVLDKLDQAGIAYEVMIPDVEKSNEQERRQQFEALRPKPLARGIPSTQNEAIANFWNTYQRFDQHSALVDALVSQNPAIVTKVEFGTSYQGRKLVAARIGANQNANKKAIWIEGGIHAREWISPATVTYFANDIVNKYNAGDADAKDVLNYFDIYVVPVLNADGYEYTHTSSRLWRKTRRPSANSPSCIGTDPNRNFGYKWGGTGASTNACSETYRGDQALSEPEVKAETDYILANLKGKIVSFLSVHSYGQYWLYPWGWGPELTPDDAEINRVAKIAVAALNQVTPSTKYTIGTSTNVLYAAAGGADDWSYGAAAATYSYTVELRDTGTYGFQLPANQIKATGAETSAAFLALAKAIKAKLG